MHFFLSLPPDRSDDNASMDLFRPRAAVDSAHQASQFDPFSPSAAGSGNKASPAAKTERTASATTTPAPAFEHPPDPALPRGPPATDQAIVPQLVIDHYVSMIDPSRAQTVDSEIARHCAFSLPAVALTLGRANWPLLKTTYEALAHDMQWKVRRTLASSIHELGVILGEEASSTDLIPVFNGFLKDLDEVRQGLLKHLADFLRLLDPEHRREYLPKLSEFLKMDNDRNWRFRQELAEQLERLIPLFSPEEVSEHLSPIAMVLVYDKVAAVRDSVVNMLANIVRSFNQAGKADLSSTLLVLVVESLACGGLWVHRQTFATLCLRLHTFDALPPAEFSISMLPRLLEMASDPVPNVRLAVARTLRFISRSAAGAVYKDAAANKHAARLSAVEAALRCDNDVDVRQMCGVAVTTGTSSRLKAADDDVGGEEEGGGEEAHDDEEEDEEEVGGSEESGRSAVAEAAAAVLVEDEEFSNVGVSKFYLSDFVQISTTFCSVCLT